MSEVDRIRLRYALRDAQVDNAPKKLWDNFSLLEDQWLRKALLNALNGRFGDRDARSLTALDIGGGAGGSLLRLVELGFTPQNLIGIELMGNRVAQAQHRLPAAIRIIEGDATVVDLPVASFDVVQQLTVFTSILDDVAQEALARRMWELLRPGGLIVWYDFIYNNPRNKDVRAVPIPRIRTLFPDGRLTVRRVTLAPPIGRPAARISPRLYSILNAVPLLRSHVFGVISKD